MGYRAAGFALTLFLLVLIPQCVDAQTMFAPDVNTTVIVHPPLGGGWNLGPVDSSWRINVGNSITAINSTAPAWFQYIALTNGIDVNATSETGSGNVSCLQSTIRGDGSTLGAFGDVWYNTTLNSTTATTITLGNRQNPTFYYYSFTCYMDSGISVFNISYVAGLLGEEKTEAQVNFFIMDTVYIPDNTTTLVTSPGILWSGNWEPAIVYENDASKLRTYGPTYRIARGNGSLWFPVPDNTSVMLVYGTTGIDGGNGIVTFSPDPPAAPRGSSNYRAQWNMNDTNQVISNTPLDPTIQYNMTIEPAVSGSNLSISRLWFGTGLLNPTHWPVIRYDSQNQTSSNTTQVDSPPANTSTPATKSTKAVGGIVGGAVAGVVVLIALLAFVGWRVHLRRIQLVAIRAGGPVDLAIDGEEITSPTAAGDAPRLTPYQIKAASRTRPAEEPPAEVDQAPPQRAIVREVDGGLPPIVLPPIYQSEWSGGATTATPPATGTPASSPTSSGPGRYGSSKHLMANSSLTISTAAADSGPNSPTGPSSGGTTPINLGDSESAWETNEVARLTKQGLFARLSDLPTIRAEEHVETQPEVAASPTEDVHQSKEHSEGDG